MATGGGPYDLNGGVLDSGFRRNDGHPTLGRHPGEEARLKVGVLVSASLVRY